ncbi:hypothetical protein [Anaerosporomusa subterranea]|uniref:hypothetical protein n=1 Tax=Anaerosporomusa subterranea TaxID=1794912 RepID=UPI0012E897F2|nr:hypothetical protein [Anaerosporomusa subterranea]
MGATDFYAQQSDILNKLRVLRENNPERSVSSILKDWRLTAIKNRKKIPPIGLH